MDKPRTLLEAVTYFEDIDRCIDYLAARRWPNGVICPTCGAVNPPYRPTRRVWECRTRHPRREFSVKVGTIFEDSPIGLDKWLPTVWQIANCKNGVSSYEIARALGVTQKTAWFMLHRVRLAMQAAHGGGKLGGRVEVDETYIGAKARNMHKSKKARMLQGRRGGMAGKVAVMGLLQRHEGKNKSKVRLQVVTGVKRGDLMPHVRAQVAPGSNLYTDALPSYLGLDGDYMHGIIDHAERYVDGQVHTNGLENFWSLLKRSLNGTYVSVEPFHLFRYLDEQAFRFNERGTNDAERFENTVDGILGRRLTYENLTGGPRPESL